MENIDLKDLTFLIPVRIDSNERHENIKMVLEYLKSNFNTTIIVLEADAKEQVNNKLIDEKIFIKDTDPVFHRTKFLNEMTCFSNTPYLAIWDTDVLVAPHQIVKAVNLLRQTEAGMVFPYNGQFYNMPELIKEVFKENGSFEVFEKNTGKFKLAYGSISVGGAFIVSRKKYIKAGMENENFYGWGPEDMERVKRWEILGYKIHRVDGPMFHLHHPRKQNSWFYDVEIELRNRKELLRICKMNSEELGREVSRWELTNVIHK
jgi:predicted glycosyltransferase involved in capsule biosynthesis